ncbi:MAG: N-acetylmuramoyl-L-alanine amidase family protein [Maricaulaceae bacterium]
MRFIWLICFWLFSLSAPVAAQVLSSIDQAVTPAGTRIDFVFSNEQPSSPKLFTIVEDPARIVVDWETAKENIKSDDTHKETSAIKGQGGAKRIRYAVRGETGLRAVIDIHADVTLMEHSQNANGYTVWISNGAGSGSQNQKGTWRDSARYFEKGIPFPRLKPEILTQTERKPVIVIDPGHGGRDPGAIGRKGTREKGITLAASLELKKQLLATKRYDVIITRGTDVYIDHEERLRIARAGGADLFISIHADSTAGSKARGASVYTLSERSKSRSKNIVNNQNWIMDVDLASQSDPVGDILVDLAQRKTASQSAMFADVLISSLSNSTRLIGNTHRRAGYFVLLAPDVPAVLLELGFLSNPDDEKLLKNERHRKKLVRAVVRGINTYFDTQNP